MRQFVLLGLLLGGLHLSMAVLVAAEVSPRDSKQPNIVVMLVDDLRWDELGDTGHPFVRTPHIDRIAHEGVRFRNAFCTTLLCSPASLAFWRWATGPCAPSDANTPATASFGAWMNCTI